MTTLRKILKNKLADARRIAVLGIGSDLRGDDAAGVIAAEELARKSRSSRLKVFIGATAPENLTGEIKKFKPTHLILIDTIEMKKRPGTIFIMIPEDVGGGVSFSTHNLPAKVLIDYLLASFKCEVIMVGVQPKSVEFGKPPIEAVIKSAKEIAGAIAWSLRRR